MLSDDYSVAATVIFVCGWGRHAWLGIDKNVMIEIEVVHVW